MIGAIGITLTIVFLALLVVRESARVHGSAPDGPWIAGINRILVVLLVPFMVFTVVRIVDLATRDTEEPPEVEETSTGIPGLPAGNDDGIASEEGAPVFVLTVVAAVGIGMIVTRSGHRSLRRAADAIRRAVR